MKNNLKKRNTNNTNTKGINYLPHVGYHKLLWRLEDFKNDLVVKLFYVKNNNSNQNPLPQRSEFFNFIIDCFYLSFATLLLIWPYILLEMLERWDSVDVQESISLYDSYDNYFSSDNFTLNDDDDEIEEPNNVVYLEIPIIFEEIQRPFLETIYGQIQIEHVHDDIVGDDIVGINNITDFRGWLFEGWYRLLGVDVWLGGEQLMAWDNQVIVQDPSQGENRTGRESILDIINYTGYDGINPQTRIAPPGWGFMGWYDVGLPIDSLVVLQPGTLDNPFWLPEYSPPTLPEYSDEPLIPYDLSDEIGMNGINNTLITNLESNLNQNELAFQRNQDLHYDIVTFGEGSFIVTDSPIFTREFIQVISDISYNISEEIDSIGNRITNLRIDPEVANNLQTMDPQNSGRSLFTGVAHSLINTSDEYEQQIRGIRDNNVSFNSTEIREYIAQTNRGGELSIIDTHSTHSTLEEAAIREFTTEELRYLETNHNRILAWRENIQILIHNSNMSRQPWPMWSEVPPRPTNPSEIELWERDNVVRRFWSNRLNGGYTQTNVIIETPSNNTLFETISKDIFEDDSLHLDLLFNESENPITSDNSLDYDTMEEDSLHIDKFQDNSDVLKTTDVEVKDIFNDDSLYLDLLFENKANI